MLSKEQLTKISKTLEEIIPPYVLPRVNTKEHVKMGSVHLQQDGSFIIDYAHYSQAEREMLFGNPVFERGMGKTLQNSLAQGRLEKVTNIFSSLEGQIPGMTFKISSVSILQDDIERNYTIGTTVKSLSQKMENLYPSIVND